MQFSDIIWNMSVLDAIEAARRDMMSGVMKGLVHMQDDADLKVWHDMQTGTVYIEGLLKANVLRVKRNHLSHFARNHTDGGSFITWQGLRIQDGGLDMVDDFEFDYDPEIPLYPIEISNS